MWTWRHTRAIAHPFVVSDAVMLYSPRLTPTGDEAKADHKLWPQWNGLFTIVEINPMGDVFTVRNTAQRMLRVELHDLKPYHPPSYVPPPLPHVAPPGNNPTPRSYAVDKILGHWKANQTYLYTVRWAAPFNDPAHNLEVRVRSFDRTSLQSLPPMLVAYWATMPNSERPLAYRNKGPPPQRTRQGKQGPTSTAPTTPCNDPRQCLEHITYRTYITYEDGCHYPANYHE